RAVNRWIFWACILGPALLISVSALIVRRLPATSAIVRLAHPSRAAVVRTSRWAARGDLRSLFVNNVHPGRFVLGRHGHRKVATALETSVLVIGPTRSGKTSSLVIPNLLDWHGPAVVTSTKSELVRLTAAHRQRSGPVFIYDPVGDSAPHVSSVTWSPIAGCDDLDRAWTVASWLCAGLRPSSSRGDSDWAHWAESGRLLVAPLLYAAASNQCSVVDVR